MRKGAGTILLIGFAITVLVMTLAAYLSPPEIKMQAGVHEEFVDSLSYLTSVVDTAARLPGTTEEKADFINKSFSYLSRELIEKGINLTYVNITLPAAGGGEDNVLVIYTLTKGDTFFTGILATNLTAIEEGIGSGYGGGGGVPPGVSGSGGESPFGTFPGKIAFFPDIKWVPYPIMLLVFNFNPTDYNLTIEFDGGDWALWGWYINFRPLWMKWFWEPRTMDVYISARERGITGLGYVYIQTLRTSSEDDYVHFCPKEEPDLTSMTQIHYTNDFEDFIDTWKEGIKEGVSNLRRWARAGR